MTYRQTFVVEYPDASHAPPVGADMTMLGGKLVACQFDDALEEIEALLECCDAGCIAKANAMRARMKAERLARPQGA